MMWPYDYCMLLSYFVNVLPDRTGSELKRRLLLLNIHHQRSFYLIIGELHVQGDDMDKPVVRTKNHKLYSLCFYIIIIMNFLNYVSSFILFIFFKKTIIL
jgi:hypothetical protein